MQKCPNWNILSPSGMQVWDVLVIQGELRSKNGIKQNVLRIAFKEGSLLCKKNQICNFVFDFLQTSPFDGP